MKSSYATDSIFLKRPLIFRRSSRYLLGALYTICIMLFSAGSSPVVNSMGTDSSVFFTIGRSMLSGKVPYRDLFDHKGWYVYFFNYLGACLSSKTTIGLFIIECAFMIINVILLFKITDLISGNRVSEICKSLSVGLMLLLILNFFTYQGGNFVETYGLTFQFLSVFLIIKYYKRKVIDHPPLFMFFHGICAGIALSLRLNMAAMWGGIAIVLLLRLIFYKKYKSILLNAVSGSLGVCTGILPVIIYCLNTHSLKPMIQQSLFFNLQYSSNGSSVENFFQLFTNIRGFCMLLGCLISLIIVIRSAQFSRSFRAMYAVSLLLSAFSVSLSGRNYGHYYEYLIPFFLPAVLFLTEKAALFSEKLFCHRKLLIAGLFTFTVCVNLQMPVKLFSLTNIPKISQTADNMADIYHKYYSDRKTVLTVNNKSMFYNKFNVIPEDKFFYIPAISYQTFPDAVNAQVQSILSGKNDIIILSYQNAEKKQIFPYGIKNREILQYLSDHYQMIYEQNHIQMYIKQNFAINEQASNSAQ